MALVSKAWKARRTVQWAARKENVQGIRSGPRVKDNPDDIRGFQVSLTHPSLDRGAAVDLLRLNVAAVAQKHGVSSHFDAIGDHASFSFTDQHPRLFTSRAASAQRDMQALTTKLGFASPTIKRSSSPGSLSHSMTARLNHPRLNQAETEKMLRLAGASIASAHGLEYQFETDSITRRGKTHPIARLTFKQHI